MDFFSILIFLFLDYGITMRSRVLLDLHFKFTSISGNMSDMPEACSAHATH